MELAEIGKNILINCMNVKPGENVLIVTDDEKYAIGQALYQAAKLLKAEAMLMTMPAREVSGQEPPAVVAAAMKAADVVICPMKTSITHTRAKIEAAEAGARIATMPGITEEMFAMGAMTADYSRVMALTEQVTDLLTNANTARIEKDGHVLTLDLRGRRGVSSHGVYREKGQAGNLPSGESYIAPIETGANGTMVIDGSMVGIGLLEQPLEVKVKDGVLQSIQGKEAEKLDELKHSVQNASYEQKDPLLIFKRESVNTGIIITHTQLIQRFTRRTRHRTLITFQRCNSCLVIIQPKTGFSQNTFHLSLIFMTALNQVLFP